MEEFTYYTGIKAKTALDSAGITKILFNASNDGGDNFRIRGRLTVVRTATSARSERFPREDVDPITVWRRMNVLVYAMNRRDPLAEIIRPGPNGHLEFGSVLGRGGDDSLQNVVIHPGADGTMESVIAVDDVANAAGTISPGVNDRFDTPIAGTDEYRGVILAGANGIAETTAVPDDVQVVAINAGTYYPFDGGEGSAGVFDAFRNAYGDGGGTSDQAGYIETNVQDAQTRASLGSDFDHQDPYILADGQTLSIRVNGAAPVTVTFRAADFAGIGMADTAEIVAVINATSGLAGVARTVDFSRGGTLAIRQLCLRATLSIEITGGTAAAPLGLPIGEVVTRNHTRYVNNINYTYIPDWDILVEQFVRLQTDFHLGDNPSPNPANTLQLIGVGNLLTGSFGSTKRQPHSLVNVGLLETRIAGGTRGAATIQNNSMHESGHSLMQQGTNLVGAPAGVDDYHDYHTDSPATGGDGTCVWNTPSDAAIHICPRHLRLMRNSIFRTWTDDNDQRQHRD